jgi:OPT oligopeptide transporter protein
MYGIGSRYQIVSIGFLVGIILPVPFWLIHKYVPGGSKLRLDYWNIAIICGYLGSLSHGTTSAFLFHFAVGFASQFWLRKYKTNWFIKYNYIMSAGLDGGAQVISFLLTFTVLGASGKAVDFPAYFGNNFNKGNFDYCMADPALTKGKKHRKISSGGGDGGGGGGGE